MYTIQAAVMVPTGTAAAASSPTLSEDASGDDTR